MTTYLLITSNKPTELTASTDGKNWLPVLNASIRDSVHGLIECKILFGLDGHIEIKLDTTVELPGWEPEIVMSDGWQPTYNNPDNYGCEQPAEPVAYRLKRSEPVKPNNSPFDLLDDRGDLMGTQPFINDPDYPELLKESWDWSKKSPDLKALCWVLDRIWAKVSPAEEATTSWGRQESGKAIEAYMNSILAPESHKTQESQEDLFHELFGRLYDTLERGNGTMENIKKEFILTRRNP